MRKFSFDDVNDIVEYANSPGWGKFLPVPSPYTKSDANDFISKVLNDNVVQNWAIEIDGKAVGGIGLTYKNNEAILGYCLHSGYWGKGYMTEAAAELVRLALEKYDRITITADTKNKASIAVMCKLGGKLEGIKRSVTDTKNYRVHDEVMWGILKGENNLIEK